MAPFPLVRLDCGGDKHNTFLESFVFAQYTYDEEGLLNLVISPVLYSKFLIRDVFFVSCYKDIDAIILCITVLWCSNCRMNVSFL